MIYSELFIFAANFAKRRIRCSMPECGGSKAESRTAAKAILVLLLDHMTAERIRALARELSGRRHVTFEEGTIDIDPQEL
jgi:hypothetical protein